MSNYEVQTKLGKGAVIYWRNVWFVFCSDLFGGVTDKPMTFDTKEEAQRELAEHLEREAAAYAGGDAGYAPHLSEYRIVERVQDFD